MVGGPSLKQSKQKRSPYRRLSPESPKSSPEKNAFSEFVPAPRKNAFFQANENKKERCHFSLSKYVKTANENIEYQISAFEDIKFGNKYEDLRINSGDDKTFYPASIDNVNTDSKIQDLNKTMRSMKYSLDCALRGISNHDFH